MVHANKHANKHSPPSAKRAAAPPVMPDPNALPSKLQVELLGSGGYHPSERRHTACVLIPQLSLMLDAGTAAFRAVERIASGALPAGRLDIVLTHAHLDHIVGLTFLLGLELDGVPVETVVHAAPAVIDAIEQHLTAPPVFPIKPITRFEPLGESLTLPCGAVMTTFPLDHPGGSLGLRINSGGKTLAYVTDTRPITPATHQEIAGVDLLMHEAYFNNARRKLADASGHCTAADAAQAAVTSGAKRLVMMHINPRATPEEEAAALAEATAIRTDAEFGRDGMVIEI